MDDRINKSVSDKYFYLIALIAALLIMLFLPGIIMPIGASIYEGNHPGFYTQFMEDMIKLNESGSNILYSELSPLTLNILVLAQFLSSLLLIVLFVIFLRKVFIRDFKNFKKKIWFNLLSIVLWALVILLMSLGIAVLFEILGVKGTPANEENINTLFESQYGSLMMISAILFAPIVEEMIFRKLTFGTLEKLLKLPSYVVVVVAAIIFALFHQTDIFFFMYFTMALTLSVCYSLHKNNIYIPIGVHLLNNSVAAFLMILVF